MHLCATLFVKDELEKFLNVGFIYTIDYSEWMSNIVLVSKHEKSIRVCIDFQDINKACPKDNFPLPNIDMIVDMTTRYEIYSLMNAFFGYNKIKIVPKDQEKTSFTCEWGTFFQNVMPFGLKNAGVTYQFVMMTIFYDMTCKIVEDYIDDTLVKSMQ